MVHGEGIPEMNLKPRSGRDVLRDGFVIAWVVVPARSEFDVLDGAVLASTLPIVAPVMMSTPVSFRHRQMVR